MEELAGRVSLTFELRDESELTDIAAKVLSQLRQERLTIGEIKRIAALLSKLTDYIKLCP